jgi:hypothetical protein
MAMAEIEPMSGEAFRRRQRSKNVVIAWVVAGLCALFFVITIVKMGGG